MTNHSRVLYAAMLVVFLAGLLAFWPIALLAALAGALFGYPRSAIVLSIILDIAYGAPDTPLIRLVGLPFTAAIIAVIILKYLSTHFFSEEKFDTR
ncbi:MAG: hypothetical protein ACREGH_00175 [Minisyncoccia bacterium]